MPRYKVATNNRELIHADKFDGCPIVDSVEKVGAMLARAGFDGCAVWRFDAPAKYWRLIFDTTLPDAGRLPGARYWQNVAAHEASGGRE